MNQFPAWGKLARSEIQIGPDQHDIAVGVTVAGVKLRTCPLLNFRSEREIPPGSLQSSYGARRGLEEQHNRRDKGRARRR